MLMLARAGYLSSSGRCRLHRWNERVEEGLREIGTVLPGLKHLKLVECKVIQRIIPPAKQLELESLSLASSEWSGWAHPPFVGPQLKQLDLSHTNIGDDDLRGVVGYIAPCGDRHSVLTCRQA